MEVSQWHMLSITRFDAKRTAYLETIRTVAFTEDHHLVGVYKLLYPSFEFGLPAVIFDRRHFQVFPSACAGQALVDGELKIWETSQKLPP